jgi:hypothetical protein
MEESLCYLDSWVAYNFSYIIGPLLFFCQNHFSSFSSLQDDRISTVEMHILQKIQILCKSYVLTMICAHFPPPTPFLVP